MPSGRREEQADACNEEGREPFGSRPSLILAAIYSRGTYRPTTIDVLMFHVRVRNGTGWGHQAMTTRLQEAFLFFFLFARSAVLRGVVCWMLRQADIRVAFLCCLEF